MFDSKTGAYKRHWGAYGAKELSDDKLPAYKPVAVTELSKSFANPVHCVRLSRDGLVYVCDRSQRPYPGVQEGRHVREGVPGRAAERCRTARCWDLVLSEDRAQRYIFIADGAQHAGPHHRSPDRREGRRASAARGHMAGNFKWVHNSGGSGSKGTDLHGQRSAGRGVALQKFKRAKLVCF